MENIRSAVFSLLLLGVPLSAAAGGFGFGFSDDGVDAWDPEDYPGGYPVTRSHRWDWGSQYRRFAPPSETGDNAGWGNWGSRKKHAKSDDDWTSSWGSDEPKRLKFGTGKFDFGDNSWSPHFGKSWGRGRRLPPPPPWGYYPPAPPAWGAGYGYPPAPAWGGYAAPQPAPAPVAPVPAQPKAKTE